MKVTHDPFEYPLACAACGDARLHHGSIDVYARTEDAPRGIHVTVEELTASITTELAGNPSYRRDGLTVEFWCETCTAPSLLTIAQHKGQTFITYSVLPERLPLYAVKEVGSPGAAGSPAPTAALVGAQIRKGSSLMPFKTRSVVVTAEVLSALSLRELRRLVDAALQTDERLVVRQIQANVIDQTKPAKPKKK